MKPCKQEDKLTQIELSISRLEESHEVEKRERRRVTDGLESAIKSNTESTKALTEVLTAFNNAKGFATVIRWMTPTLVAIGGGAAAFIAWFEIK